MVNTYLYLSSRLGNPGVDGSGVTYLCNLSASRCLACWWCSISSYGIWLSWPGNSSPRNRISLNVFYNLRTGQHMGWETRMTQRRGVGASSLLLNVRRTWAWSQTIVILRCRYMRACLKATWMNPQAFCCHDRLEVSWGQHHPEQRQSLDKEFCLEYNGL